MAHDGKAVYGIKALNKEQKFALDLLLDETIQVVTLVGKAGTARPSWPWRPAWKRSWKAAAVITASSSPGPLCRWAMISAISPATRRQDPA